MLISKVKNWVAGFFYFNKQERNGVFILCILLGLVIGIKLLLPLWLNPTGRVEFITLAPEVPDEPVADYTTKQPDFKPSPQFKNTQHDKFVFNPNTISEEDAKALGFSEKLSARLINFRNKGGKFFKREDLKKLYGMSPVLYAELESYVLIPTHKKTFQKDTIYPKRAYEKKLFAREVVEINSADSLAIVFLKGIGPGFTKRIIKYRTLLGGFHSIDQLKEIYGMNDSIYGILSSQISLDKSKITRIPVNVIDLNSLKKHPYLSFQAAQAIVNYRSKHGKLTEDNIISLGVIHTEKLNLILPYLEY